MDPYSVCDILHLQCSKGKDSSFEKILLHLYYLDCNLVQRTFSLFDSIYKPPGRFDLFPNITFCIQVIAFSVKHILIKRAYINAWEIVVSYECNLIFSVYTIHFNFRCYIWYLFIAKTGTWFGIQRFNKVYYFSNQFQVASQLFCYDL